MFIQTVGCRHSLTSGALSVAVTGLLLLTACESGTSTTPEARDVPAEATALEGAAVAISPEVARQTLSGRASRFKRAIEERHPDLAFKKVEGGEAYVWLVSNGRGDLIHTSTELNAPEAAALEEIMATRYSGFSPENVAVMGVQSFAPGKIGPNRLTVYFLQEKLNSPVPPTGSSVWEIPDYAPLGALEAAVKQLHPELLRDGLDSDKAVWFLADGYGDVQASGILAEYSEPQDFRAMLNERFPRAEVFYRKFSVEIEDDSGDHITVLWASAEV